MITKELIITEINKIKLLNKNCKNNNKISFNTLNEYISFLLFTDIDLLNELNYEIKKSLLDYYIIYTTYKYFGFLSTDIDEVKLFLINNNIISEKILDDLYNLNKIKIEKSKYVLLNEIHYANKNKNSILFAKTGTGKTTNIIKYSKIINKKLIIVEPLKSIIESFVDKSNEYGSYYSKNKEIKDITFVILESIDEVLNKINQNEYMICVDEIHVLFTSANWRKSVEKILLLDKCIGLTGTPPFINIPKFNNIVSSIAENDIIINKLFILDIKSNNTITNKFNSVDISMFNIYKYILSEKNNSINILFNNLNDKDIFNTFKEINNKLTFMSRNTIDDEEVKIDYDILIKDKILIEDIYSTSILEMGIDIVETLDREINIIINLDRCNIYSLTQFVSRFRDKKINLIILKTNNRLKKKKGNNVMNSIENKNIEVNNYIKNNNDKLINYLRSTFKINEINEIEYIVDNKKTLEFIKYYLIGIINNNRFDYIKNDKYLFILFIRFLYLFIKYKEKDRIINILSNYLTENDIIMNEYFINKANDNEIKYNILNIFSIIHNNKKYVDSKLFNILNINENKLNDIHKIEFIFADDEIKEKLYKKCKILY